MKETRQEKNIIFFGARFYARQRVRASCKKFHRVGDNRHSTQATAAIAVSLLGSSSREDGGGGVQKGGIDDISYEIALFSPTANGSGS